MIKISELLKSANNFNMIEEGIFVPTEEELKLTGDIELIRNILRNQ